MVYGLDRIKARLKKQIAGGTARGFLSNLWNAFLNAGKGITGGYITNARRRLFACGGLKASVYIRFCKRSMRYWFICF